MKRKWKIWLIVVGVLVVAGGVIAGVSSSKRGIVEVQTGRTSRQDLTSIVTASGEIKPKNYINIGANAQGVITGILVKEGDRVRKGELLARLESVQPQADVNAQQAGLSSAEADTTAAESSVKAADENLVSAQATVDRAKADLEQSPPIPSATMKRRFVSSTRYESSFSLRFSPTSVCAMTIAFTG